MDDLIHCLKCGKQPERVAFHVPYGIVCGACEVEAILRAAKQDEVPSETQPDLSLNNTNARKS